MSAFPSRPPSCGLPLRRPVAAICATGLLAISTPADAQLQVEVDGKTFSLFSSKEFVDDLRGASTGETLTYERAIFQGRVNTSGIDTIRAGLELRDVRFMGPVSFDWATFGGDVHGERVHFEKGASFLEASFLSGCHLSDSRFDGQITFKRVGFAGDTAFENNLFTGITTFIDAKFDGEASFANSTFDDAAYFERCHFARGSSFVDVNLVYGGSFKEGVWRGPADFAGSRFFSKASFQDTRFEAVDFRRARFAGNLSFSRSDIKGVARFQETAFLKEAHFDNVRFHDHASFSNSRFRRFADFTNTFFSDILFLDAHFPGTLDLRHASGPYVDLRPPTTDEARRAHDDTTTAAPRVYLQDTRFANMVLDWPSLSGKLATDDTTSIDDLRPVYSILRHHLQLQGLHGWAAAAQVEWLDRRLCNLSPSAADWYLLHVLNLTTGYGTQPWRTVLFGLGVVVLFGLLYIPHRSSIRAEGTDLPADVADCFQLSASAFVRLGWARWQMSGTARGLLVAEGLIGWMTWGLFVASIVAFFLR